MIDHQWRILFNCNLRYDQQKKLYFGICKVSVARLQVVHNASMRLLTGAKERDHIAWVISFYIVYNRIHFKALLFVVKPLMGSSTYISDLLCDYYADRSLGFLDLLVHDWRLSDCAFALTEPYAGIKLHKLSWQIVSVGPNMNVGNNKHAFLL